MSLFSFRRCSIMPLRFSLKFPCNAYAKKDTGAVSMVGGVLKKKKMGKIGPMMEKKILPVETDSKKLVNFVCGSNIFKTGEDIALKPDSAYPDWLWNIRIGPAPKLEELELDTREYYMKVRKLAMRRNNKMAQLKRF